MKIQATKVMAQAINKAFKAKGWEGYKATQVMLTSQQYSWYVGDIYDAEDYGDYSDQDDKYRAICVTYPADYYACDRYITSKELNHLFTKGDTLDSFIAKVLEDVEI